MSVRSTAWLVRIAVAALTVFPVAACASDGSGSTAADEETVAVTLDDGVVTLTPDAVSAGAVALTATNEGTQVHEFEVLGVPEGVDANALPVQDNVADVASQGLEVVDEIEDIAPGTTAELSLDLEPGTYVVICNLAGHYAMGMHATLTVG